MKKLGGWSKAESLRQWAICPGSRSVPPPVPISKCRCWTWRSWRWCNCRATGSIRCRATRSINRCRQVHLLQTGCQKKPGCELIKTTQHTNYVNNHIKHWYLLKKISREILLIKIMYSIALHKNIFCLNLSCFDYMHVTFLLQFLMNSHYQFFYFFTLIKNTLSSYSYLSKWSCHAILIFI